MKKLGLLVIMLLGLCAAAYFTSSSALEFTATLSGLLCVWLTARQNIWCWPIGLVNVICFFAMFYEAKLYADMLLQVFFFVMSVQGWIVWLTGRGTAKVRPTRRLTLLRGILLGIAVIAVTGGWGMVLERYTDASIPYLDAFLATLSLAAQLLLSSKVLENWVVWIAVDVLSVGMYAYKELYLIALLYAVFLGIAVSGLLSWRSELQLHAWPGARPLSTADQPEYR
ncbi:nicotinamide riboside transporter PnuC [Paenibacillus sp. y28]|uniref:nicotinamide riboside transporter PnuC n=1 Tax=Paenibacillus sp. y28 TaxID=3129110 RepID=UPI003017F202